MDLDVTADDAGQTSAGAGAEATQGKQQLLLEAKPDAGENKTSNQTREDEEAELRMTEDAPVSISVGYGGDERYDLVLPLRGDCATASIFLREAAEKGLWGGAIRKALERYLDGKEGELIIGTWKYS
jgi:hypothetical protein